VLHLVQIAADGIESDLGPILSSSGILDTGGTAINPATEDKQDDSIVHLANIAGGVDWNTSTGLGRDASTWSIQTVDYAHHEIHSGSSYAVHTAATLASAATLVVAFKTADSAAWPHMIVAARSSGESNLKLYEGGTWTTSSGSALTCHNRNRNSSNTSGILGDSTGTFTAGVMVKDPTGVNVGAATLFCEQHLGSGRIVGGEARGVSEWILKANTNYVFVFTSEANSNDCQIHLDWYEHTDKE
jgi:hypothetical protein